MLLAQHSAVPAVQKPATLSCRLCEAEAVLCGDQIVLGRFNVLYYRCPVCDLIQTEQPTWLAEAYGGPNAAIDTGVIDRNRLTARLTWLTASVLGLRPTARCLDYGGGHGVFVRMMRDSGLDFRWFDRFAENLYARGFEASPADRYDLVTAFEVFEHFVDVRAELTTLFAPRHRYVLGSTLLHEGFNRDWWYLAPESGQHVAFFSRRTLAWIADAFGYDVAIGPSYTLFAEKGSLGSVRRSAVALTIARARFAFRVASLIPEFMIGNIGRFRSRTASDSEALRRAKE
jgi:hypothetical protein